MTKVNATPFSCSFRLSRKIERKINAGKHLHEVHSHQKLIEVLSDSTVNRRHETSRLPSCIAVMNKNSMNLNWNWKENVVEWFNTYRKEEIGEFWAGTESFSSFRGFFNFMIWIELQNFRVPPSARMREVEEKFKWNDRPTTVLQYFIRVF